MGLVFGQLYTTERFLVSFFIFGIFSGSFFFWFFYFLFLAFFSVSTLGKGGTMSYEYWVSLLLQFSCYHISVILRVDRLIAIG
ncbi:hypothetical protein QBC36DRAFT_331903 [Triangularia setosa]|uniref:Uncharacterized protein n=1 Tax=Triangularia setosa TaxID=2587417 RepID=A0AAN6W554_9PEZI|nr:hypothetical protein QBC36DRAFT_331903 [Podospora setosa]